tara:strand:+ start:48 stop:1043 length:996 start_codon:yes stop_codon:yes gene_type:complete
MGFFSTLKNRARQPVMAPSLPMAMPVDAKQMQQFTKPQGLPPIGPIDRPLSPSIVRPSELPATPSRPIPFGPGHPLFDPPRGGRRGGIGMPRPKKIKTDKGLGSIQKFFDRQRLGNIPMQDVPAAPVPFEMDRVPFERPGFAEGEDVRSGMRSGSTGPRVQNLTPGKGMIGTKAGLGSGKFRLPNPGTITAAARGAAMSPISKFGIPGAIAAGGIALYQIADETGFVPEEIGKGAASLQKSFQDVVSEAVEMAQNIGAPVIDFVERVKMGYQQEMRELPRPEQFSPVTEKDMEMIRMMERNQTPPPPPMMGEVPMFAEGLAVDIENLEKKN